MPWTELCTMDVREEFVLRAQAPKANKAALCREFGISRKTAYKWLERYVSGGLGALESLSRRPTTSPLRCSGELVAEIVRLRRAHPSWGARKIAAAIRREHPALEAPGERRVHRVLVRTGFLQPTRTPRRRKSTHSGEPPRVVYERCNDVWTVDFKGWWLALDKTRCEPLTIRDAHSRFILAIDVLPTTKLSRVREVFERVFRKYGLPKVILTDNGPPFVSTAGELGLTRLSAWWLTLGIEHVRTRPGTPSDNGAHERMHRDIAAELEAFKAMSREAQQKACDRWRHQFNCHRPHEAIGMKVPADLYRRSEVDYDATPSAYVYPEAHVVRRVGHRGNIWYRKRLAFISWAIIGEEIGLSALDQNVSEVWFRHKKLGEVDFRRNPAKITPVRWVTQAVSPMTA
jgi:putative transposase